MSDPTPSPSAEEDARGIVEQWLSAGCGCGFPPSQLDDAYGQGTHKADLVDAIATALAKRDALNIEALTAAHAEIARLAGEITKRDAEIAEYAAHEEQTHCILGGILGTDDSLERCAKRMRERAEAAEARLEAMRAVVETARKVADHPEHKGGAWIGLLRDQLAALDPQP